MVNTTCRYVNPCWSDLITGVTDGQTDMPMTAKTAFRSSPQFTQ